jgi:hypothetical protein
MKPELEKKLSDSLLSRTMNGYLKRSTHLSVRDIIREMYDAAEIQSGKQAWATLEKWTDKGWYEYGVTLDLGWLTPEGIAHFKESVE